MLIVWVPAGTSTVSSTATGAPGVKGPPWLAVTAVVSWPPAAEITVTVAGGMGGTAEGTVYVSDPPVSGSDPVRLPGRPKANSCGGTCLSLEVAVRRRRRVA